MKAITLFISCLLLISISGSQLQSKLGSLQSAARPFHLFCNSDEDFNQLIVDITNCVGAIPVLGDVVGTVNQVANCWASGCLTEKGKEAENVVSCMAGFAPFAGNYLAALGCPLFDSTPEETRRFMVDDDVCYQGTGGSNTSNRKEVARPVSTSRWKSHVDEGVCPYNYAKVEDTWTRNGVQVAELGLLKKASNDDPETFIGQYVCIRSYRIGRNKDNSYLSVGGSRRKELRYVEYCSTTALWELIPLDSDEGEYFGFRNVESGTWLQVGSSKSTDPSVTTRPRDNAYLQLQNHSSGKYCIYGRPDSERRYVAADPGVFSDDVKTSEECRDRDETWEITKLPQMCSDIQHLPDDTLQKWHHRDGEQYDCEWFAQSTKRCYSDRAFESNFGHTAREACCVCVGGRRLGKL